MELSGLIFVALALVWAVVLIPKALKHHDDLAETRSVDKVSDAMRVLARREAVSARSSRLVVNPEIPVASPTSVALSHTHLRARRAAAAAAARRRRRVLLALLVITAGIGALSAAGLLSSWAPAVPVALVAAFLVIARVTVRRENARWASRTVREHLAASPTDTLEMAALREPDDTLEMAALTDSDEVPSADEQGVAVAAGGAVATDLDDTQTIPVAVLAGAEPTTDPGSLWDPLPVTLPTYVSKPRATRSVRTIDLSAPGVASAGRDAAASALVAEAATASRPSGPDGPEQRAVGS